MKCRNGLNESGEAKKAKMSAASAKAKAKKNSELEMRKYVKAKKHRESGMAK
jgi:hypothetical protein